MVKQIQFKLAPSGHRMSRLLHPAACDSSVVYCRGTGDTPALYLTLDYLLTNASTFPVSSF